MLLYICSIYSCVRSENGLCKLCTYNVYTDLTRHAFHVTQARPDITRGCCQLCIATNLHSLPIQQPPRLYSCVRPDTLNYGRRLDTSSSSYHPNTSTSSYRRRPDTSDTSNTNLLQLNSAKATASYTCSIAWPMLCIYTQCVKRYRYCVIEGLLMICLLEQRPANGRQMTRNVISLIIGLHQYDHLTNRMSQNLRMSQIQSYRDTSHSPTYASPLCRFVRGTNKLTGACEGCCGDHMMCTKWEAVCGDFLEAMKCVCGISTTASYVLVYSTNCHSPVGVSVQWWDEVICSGYDIIIWILLLVWNL